MLGLVHVTQERPPVDRMWLIFFGNGEGGAWWSRAFRPGFRHVSAACWFAGQDRWVFYQPAHYGTRIDVYRADEFGPLFGSMLEASSVVVRMRSDHASRQMTTPFFYCVGAVKALLGIRSRALSPYALFRDLRARGAEIVHAPAEGAPVVDLQSGTAEAARRG